MPQDMPRSARRATDDAGDDRAIVVLGIGNVLWADEGFGVRCVEALQARYTFAGHVQLVDGGTQGLYLIPQVHGARRLIILDAVDYGLAPGTLKLVEDDEVPRFMGAKKMSLHQTGFQEVIAAAALTGQLPEQLLLIGVQPEELDDYGGSLRPAVKARLDEAVALAVAALRDWGFAPQRRVEKVGAGDTALSMSAYEAGRPSAETASRIGDARYLDA